MSRVHSAAGSVSLTASRVRTRLLARAADYLELAKPRILVLELVTVVVAAHLASPLGVAPWLLLHTVIGAGLVAASASAFNQWWEQAADARMRRTENRPLPAGRITSRKVIAFGLFTGVVGTLQLAFYVNGFAAAAALATWLIYVLAYTPLKTRSPLNTAVGAVSGALPILIGWTAAGGIMDVRVVALLAAMFLWQFPHFMAIAWLYRSDYARAGQKMLTVVDPSGLRAGAQAVVAALALIPVSLVPALSPQAGSPFVYGVWATLLGAGQLAAAAAFLFRCDDRSARRLLRASLLYLTCWLALLMIVAV